jgi:hypothetical protein
MKGFGWRNLKGRGTLDEMIILRWILKNYTGRAEARFWLIVGINFELL